MHISRPQFSACAVVTVKWARRVVIKIEWHSIHKALDIVPDTGRVEKSHLILLMLIIVVIVVKSHSQFAVFLLLLWEQRLTQLISSPSLRFFFFTWRPGSSPHQPLLFSLIFWVPLFFFFFFNLKCSRCRAWCCFLLCPHSLPCMVISSRLISFNSHTCWPFPNVCL